MVLSTGSYLWVQDTGYITSSYVYANGLTVYTGATITGSLTMRGSIIPDADSTYDLGSTTKQWKHVYISTGSIYMNGIEVMLMNSNNQVVIGNQTINTTGTTGVTITSISGSQIITGSQIISGSLNVTGSAAITGSLIVNNATHNGTSLTTTSGTSTIQSDLTGSFNSVFYKYSIKNGVNARAGEVTAVWNGSTIVYEEYSTVDVGNTTDLTFSVALSGTNVNLNAASTGGWTVKTSTLLL
jgi:hypothetical protein